MILIELLRMIGWNRKGSLSGKISTNNSRTLRNVSKTWRNKNLITFRRVLNNRWKRWNSIDRGKSNQSWKSLRKRRT